MTKRGQVLPIVHFFLGFEVYLALISLLRPPSSIAPS